MKKISFNDNWLVKEIVDSHDESKYIKVDLPDDRAFFKGRDPKQKNGTKKGYFINSAYEYAKIFEISNDDADKCVIVEFEGVMNSAMVYVNGNYVGKHNYGYTEFSFDITKYVKFGEKNIISVTCKTSDDSRWYTGSGIYRDVNLYIANNTHIALNGLRLKTVGVVNGNAEIIAEINHNGRDNVEVIVELFDGDKLVASAKGNKMITLHVQEAKLWSDDSPYLYSVKASLIQDDIIVDELVDVFGIRTMSVSAKNGLLINGKRVLLRGACIHHDSGVIGARTFKDIERRKVEILKNSGFNAIRSAHHPMGRALLKACDELGVFVMDEAFDMWQENKSVDDYACVFDDNYAFDIKAMVDKDYNHPCVIMYSIGNEISDLATLKGVETAKMLSSLIKERDDSRFTTVAINGFLLLMSANKCNSFINETANIENKGDVNETMSSMGESMAGIATSQYMNMILEGGCSSVDIAGYNYMHSRYEYDKTANPDRVIVGSETFANDIYDMWSYMNSNNNVIGDFTWTGLDYLGETGIGTSSYTPMGLGGFYKLYPEVTGNCGDIDITGYRLPQSYYREIVFGLRKEPYITVHYPEHCEETEYKSVWGWGDNTSSWSFDGFEGRTLTVDVYGDGELELFLNGRSLGKKLSEKCKCTFDVLYESGELKAVAYNKNGTYDYSLVSAKGYSKLCVKPEKLRINSNELLCVNLSICDDDDTVLYGQDKEVILKVSNGKLLGFGSGSHETEGVYSDDNHSTYHGRAFAIIKPDKSGLLEIEATADGISTIANINVIDYNEKNYD